RAPAFATAATSSARPTHCMPPCTIGCSTPTSSVNRVLIILTPDGFPGAVTFAHALIFRIFRRQDAVASGKCPLARGCEVLPGFGWRNSNADHRRLRVLPEQGDRGRRVCQAAEAECAAALASSSNAVEMSRMLTTPIRLYSSI